MSDKYKKGFSLLELILAVTFFMLGSIAAGYLIINASVTTQQVIERNDAVLVAREGIEAVTSMRDGGFTTTFTGRSGPNGVSNPTGIAWGWNGAESDVVNSKYARSILVTLNPVVGPFPITATALIESRVTWVGANGKTDSVSLFTVLTNMKGN